MVTCRSLPWLHVVVAKDRIEANLARSTHPLGGQSSVLWDQYGAANFIRDLAESFPRKPLDSRHRRARERRAHISPPDRAEIVEASGEKLQRIVDVQHVLPLFRGRPQ